MKSAEGPVCGGRGRRAKAVYSMYARSGCIDGSRSDESVAVIYTDSDPGCRSCSQDLPFTKKVTVFPKETQSHFRIHLAAVYVAPAVSAGQRRGSSCETPSERCSSGPHRGSACRCAAVIDLRGGLFGRFERVCRLCTPRTLSGGFRSGEDAPPPLRGNLTAASPAPKWFGCDLV